MVGSAGAALDEIQDFFHARQNCFPELEAAAEEIWSVGGLEPGNISRGLADYLDRELTIRVKVMPVEVMGPTRRRYDRHGRRILVSDMLPLPSRNFPMALPIALIRSYERLVGNTCVSTCRY